MKIAIMGSGGVGGYLGARLAAAGQDVTFIARGAHLAAMKSGGLRVYSELGDVELSAVSATDDPAQAGPADVVVFAVKLYDMEAAAAATRPLLGRGTVVIPFVNGVDAPAVLAPALGEEHVALGVIRIAAVIESPGTIRHTGKLCDSIVGSLRPEQRETVAAFQQALSAAGVACRVADDIRTEMWKKMVFIASFGGMTAVTRAPCGVFRGDPELAELFRRSLTEAAAVGRACGAALPESLADDIWSFVQGLPGGMRSSLQHDLENGRRLELPWLSGALVRLGREHGIETPVHAFIAAVLGPWVGGKTG